MTASALIYRIDDRDEIVFVNPVWEAFARDNGAPHLATGILGTSLWSHVHGEEVLDFNRRLVDDVRRSGRGLKLPFRCDAPDLLRSLELEVLPLEDDQLEFRSRLLRSATRPPIPVPLEDADALFVVCAWCKRLQTPSGWLELEEATRRSLLPDPWRRASHGICPDCLAEQRAALRCLANDPDPR